MKKIIVTLLVCIIIMLAGCDQPRDIDRAVAHAYKQCVRSNNHIIDFSTLLPFEWDTMCYYSGAYDLEYILEDLHTDLQAITYSDVGPKIYFLHQGRIVYQKGWFPYPEPEKNTIYFDTPLKKFRVGKANARFAVAKVGDRYSLSFIQEEQLPQEQFD